MLRAVDEWQTTMGVAKTKDDAADVEEMQGLTATINNLSVGQADIQMQEGFTNVMENRSQIVQKFKNYVRFNRVRLQYLRTHSCPNSSRRLLKIQTLPGLEMS